MEITYAVKYYNFWIRIRPYYHFATAYGVLRLCVLQRRNTIQRLSIAPRKRRMDVSIIIK
jgi:hypothetical protein